jgi:hypothetical protein
MNQPIAVIRISTRSCLSTQPDVRVDVRVDVRDDVKDGVKDHVRVESPCLQLNN